MSDPKNKECVRCGNSLDPEASRERCYSCGAELRPCGTAAVPPVAPLPSASKSPRSVEVHREPMPDVNAVAALAVVESPKRVSPGIVLQGVPGVYLDVQFEIAGSFALTLPETSLREGERIFVEVLVAREDDGPARWVGPDRVNGGRLPAFFSSDSESIVEFKRDDHGDWRRVREHVRENALFTNNLFASGLILLNSKRAEPGSPGWRISRLPRPRRALIANRTSCSVRLAAGCTLTFEGHSHFEFRDEFNVVPYGVVVVELDEVAGRHGEQWRFVRSVEQEEYGRLDVGRWSDADADRREFLYFATAELLDDPLCAASRVSERPVSK
jgi:hypothetical protein